MMHFEFSVHKKTNHEMKINGEAGLAVNARAPTSGPNVLPYFAASSAKRLTYYLLE